MENVVGMLRERLGTSTVLTTDLDGYESDWGSKHAGPAIAVVRPSTTNEVSIVLATCDANGVAVVPQGGNTGLCGGSVPLADGHPEGKPTVILSLAQMNRILSIDVDRATVTVEAGVTIQALQEACAAEGLLFAPDWGARGSAQVGGGISTNAGGLNVLRWGSLRSQVLGLEAVLPDGRVYDGLRALRKDATGLDVKQMFIGTEGTLGIVTAAVFALHPLPSTHRTAFVALSGLDALMPFFTLCRSESGGLVSAFELMPEDGIRRVRENAPQAQHPFSEPSEWYVLLRLSGGDEVDEVLAKTLESAAAAGVITDAVLAATSDQEQNLWFIRDEVPPPFTFDEYGNKYKFDMAIPVDRVVEFFDAAGPLVDSIVAGTKTFGFGHVGDGNLHFNMYPGPDADLEDYLTRGEELVGAIDELTWTFGGTISAEHGIGQVMRQRLARQKSTVELDVVRAVKSALDPNNTMNPGKVIPRPQS